MTKKEYLNTVLSLAFGNIVEEVKSCPTGWKVVVTIPRQGGGWKLIRAQENEFTSDDHANYRFVIPGKSYRNENAYIDYVEKALQEQIPYKL